MKREYGIARCGLACCLCSENETCAGCGTTGCPDHAWCKNLKCSNEKGVVGCYDCPEECRIGLLSKTKPYGFVQFIHRYGKEKLLDCLENNEKNGVVYHRQGIVGDYDNFDDVERLIEFILNGKPKE